MEVEIDRRCYEELLGERRNMELAYEEKIAQLQDQHAEVSWVLCLQTVASQKGKCGSTHAEL